MTKIIEDDLYLVGPVEKKLTGIFNGDVFAENNVGIFMQSGVCNGDLTLDESQLIVESGVLNGDMVLNGSQFTLISGVVNGDLIINSDSNVIIQNGIINGDIIVAANAVFHMHAGILYSEIMKNEESSDVYIHTAVKVM